MELSPLCRDSAAPQGAACFRVGAADSDVMAVVDGFLEVEVNGWPRRELHLRHRTRHAAAHVANRAMLRCSYIDEVERAAHDRQILCDRKCQRLRVSDRRTDARNTRGRESRRSCWGSTTRRSAGS